MKREEKLEKYLDYQYMYVNGDPSYIHGIKVGVSWADENPKSTWISVEEKLPPQKDKDHPYSERVFVRYIERLGDQEYVRNSFDELLCIGKIKKWCRHQNNNERVTHWMPIPELPKEEQL